MKGYTYAILLLMCGMAYSAFPAMQVRGGCLYGDTVYPVGGHTIPPCTNMICDTNGQLTFHSCPRMIDCNPEMNVIGYLPVRPGKPYPDCCPQPMCMALPLPIS